MPAKYDPEVSGLGYIMVNKETAMKIDQAESYAKSILAAIKEARTSESNEDESLRPRLLREIPVGNEQEIYQTLQELRILFPSYRNDQLFVFWLGKLMEQGIDVSNFSSEVSFKS